MIKLSVVIITYNEEKNIARCLNSIQDIADEIIVVDSFSTDKTEEICKTFNVSFFKQKWLGYSNQKNFANRLAKYDFIFSIDADEALSPELKESIIHLKKQDNNNKVFQVKRITNYCGKWIKHCGWYPDVKIRIWNKNIGAWIGELHETIRFNKPVEIHTLNGDLLHYSYHSISQHIAQINLFTDIGAKEAFKKGKRSNIFIITTKAFWKFIRDYIIKLGFLDGYYGFIICALSAHATFLKYIKLRELRKIK
jgi:glycosyltransferase involved in cell wall biosynthesis